MNHDLGLLGIARRGGFLAVGDEAVSEALRRGSARLVVTASDAAYNTKRRFARRSERSPYIELPFTKEELGGALGYASCACAAVLDAGIARAFLARMGQELPEPVKQHKSEPKHTKNGGAH